MPIGLLLALSAIAGVGSLFTKRTENNFQAREAQKQRSWEEMRYEREKADREYLIEQEKLYNSPAEQSKRLLAAGINPYYSLQGYTDSYPSATVISAPEYTPENQQSESLDLDSIMSILSITREMTTAQTQQEILNLEKQKLQQDLIFGLDERLEEDEFSQLKKAYLKLQTESLKNDLQDDFDVSQYFKKYGGNEVIQILKIVLPLLVGRRRAR